METKITSQYLNREQMVLVEEFVDYCVKRFKLERYGSARIRISICQKIENGDEGNCILDDSKDYCKEVKIKIRHNKNMKRMLSVIGHEMVHARQFLSGQLKFENDKAHWKGLDVDCLDYREQPHEIEAFGLEKSILDGFYRHRKKKSQAKTTGCILVEE